MKALTILSVLFAVCLVALAGCNKSGQGVAPITKFEGVTVDWPKLDTEFYSSDLDVRSGADAAKRHIRYERFGNALAELEKLSNNPKLTEAQKKVVADLMEQTKQVLAKASPPPQ